MKRVMKEAMGDCSTIGEFRFLLRCQACGRTWHSSPVRFSKAGTKPETEGMRAVFRTLYERERAAAREKAAYLVEALGQKLGGVERIIENGNNGFSPVFTAQSNVSSSDAASFDGIRTIKNHYSMSVRFEILDQ